ncbi:hypothetical protein AG1IA_05043 [Rhizoctonia solani AG-1 IA]|uniref:Uncharacterized protein n=1 Tax=Thanatephorus cucumeris (strain AG1-IA) TaxID=983506 RepID=L8WS23_THACA|nr:hypothetical protein AG1IA_05043 [Rhizoctonia solani AG-1 IA]
MPQSGAFVYVMVDSACSTSEGSAAKLHDKTSPVLYFSQLESFLGGLHDTRSDIHLDGVNDSPNSPSGLSANRVDPEVTWCLFLLARSRVSF